MRIFPVSTNVKDFIHMFRYVSGKHEFVSDASSAEIILVVHRSALKLDLKTYGKPSVFVSLEPDENWNGSKAFLDQFDLVISSDQEYVEPCSVIHPTYTSWLLNNLKLKHKKHFLKLDHTRSIDQLKLSEETSSNVCLITSDKRFSKGHEKRYLMTKLIQGDKELSSQIDVYGAGFRNFTQKYELLKNYTHCIIIENDEKQDYWTEKLADSLILKQQILYIGCTNIESYFNTGNITRTVCKASAELYVEEIREWVLNGRFESYNDIAATKNRNKVIYEYDLISVVDRFKCRLKRSSTKVLKPSYKFSDKPLRAFAKEISYQWLT